MKQDVCIDHLLDRTYWQEVNQLGRGSYGKLYTFQNMKTDGTLIVAEALKLDRFEYKEVLDHVQIEIKKSQLLPHRRLINYFGCVEDLDNGIIYVCSEYIFRGTVRSFLNSGK